MDEADDSPNPRRFRLVFWLLMAMLTVGMTTLFLSPPPRGDSKYGFVTDHPIEVMSDSSGRWFFYGPAPVTGGTPQIAATVRKELLPQGFKEDVSCKPWFRFVKGSREVIVCNHNEIAWNPVSPNIGVIHENPPKTPGSTLWPALWVHQPGSDTTGVAAFQVKKLVMRW